MRNLIKKPMTDRARKLVVYELQRIKDAGHCPNASLDQSTVHSWADVYAPVDKPIAVANRDTTKTTREYLKTIDEVVISDKSTVKAIKEATLAKLRRVA